MIKKDKLFGLTQSEAKKKLLKQGYNEIPEQPEEKIITKILTSLSNPLILLLLLAAIISFINSYFEKSNKYVESIVIFLTIVINLAIEIFQEEKSKISLKKLMNFTKPTSAVIRDGKSKKVLSKELVVNDIVQLEAGDIVPADILLIYTNNLRINESTFTGESIPVDKEEEDVIYMGTSIVFGNAIGEVKKIGIDTELGRITKLIHNTKKEKTPLEKKINELSKLTGMITLFITLILFVIGIIRNESPLNIFMISVSLAVAAVPEGLLTIVTLILSKGVQKMAQNNAIIKKISYIETLGSVDVICTDKTGTLTENKMKVVFANTKEDIINFENLQKTDNDYKYIEVIEYAALCTNIISTYQKNNCVGDPMEIAFLEFLEKNNISLNNLINNYPKELERPFDPNKKYMSTIHSYKDKKLLIVKGAVDEILSISNLDCYEQEKILEKNKLMASNAWRILAVAFKFYPKEVENINIRECNLEFKGLIALEDPIKKSVKKAIKDSQNLGIKVIMLTGDHLETATSIGCKLGIISERKEAINKDDFDKYNKDLLNNIEEYSIYSRISPEDKLNIVETLQRKNKIVAMIGDGINDAPALKKADIGCSMGINGTDISKSIASLILIDDNFGTIITAIKQGRITIENIKKAIIFLFGSNISEILIVTFGIIIGWGSPLSPIHLLLINTLGDGFPAFALSSEEEVTQQNSKKNILTKKNLYLIFFHGFLIASLTIIVFYIVKFVLYPTNHIKGQQMSMTMSFLTLSISQLFHAYNYRSEKSLLKVGVFKNKNMNIAFIISISIILLISLIPNLQSIFELSNLNIKEWSIVLFFSFLVIVIEEIRKYIFNNKNKFAKENNHGFN